MPVAPPSPQPLSLNALRALEAAGRLGGFAAAAVELGVSPGAVTAQIKALEERLGAQLFQRSARGVALTPLAAGAIANLSQAFDLVGQASHALISAAAPQVLHVATLPAIAQLWLSPRLPGLREIAPEISVSITALEGPPNLKRLPYDVCIFYGDAGGTVLSGDVIFPVCAPAVAARLNRIEDLKHVPRLSDATWSQDWTLWMQGAGHQDAASLRGPVYSLYALAVEEAVNGAGVLIGHEALVARHLATGALVAPFQSRVTLPRALRIWTARHQRPRGALDRMMRFLRDAP
jgi:DNA-binding transcriptional LysR family regulator